MVSSTVTRRTAVTGPGSGGSHGSGHPQLLAGHPGRPQGDRPHQPVRRHPLSRPLRGRSPRRGSGWPDRSPDSRSDDLWTHFALLATAEAVAAAALDTLGKGSFDIGVTTAAGSGGCAFGQREIQALWSQGPGYVGPYQSIAWFYAASTGQISIANGFPAPVPCSVRSPPVVLTRSRSAAGRSGVAIRSRCAGAPRLRSVRTPWSPRCSRDCFLTPAMRPVPTCRSAVPRAVTCLARAVRCSSLRNSRMPGNAGCLSAEITGHTAAFAAGQPAPRRCRRLGADRGSPGVRY